HLHDRPSIPTRRSSDLPDEPNEEQRWLVEFRADIQAQRDQAAAAGEDTTDLDAVIIGLDQEIKAAGMRGNVLGRTTTKRVRSTRDRKSTRLNSSHVKIS